MRVRIFSTATLMFATALTLGACTGAADNEDPTSSDSKAGITYTVSPNTLTLAPGQSGDVMVNITRSPQFKGDLAMDVGGLFNDVTAIFNPASLSETTTSATLTIKAGTGLANFGTMSLSIQPLLDGKPVNINGTPPTLSVIISNTPTIVINKAGTGSGTITSSPAGIDCGTVCRSTFAFSPVTLTAAPANGSAFTGWTGSCAGTSLTCTFTPRVNANFNFNFATATFTSTTQGVQR